MIEDFLRVVSTPELTRILETHEIPTNELDYDLYTPHSVVFLFKEEPERGKNWTFLCSGVEWLITLMQDTILSLLSASASSVIWLGRKTMKP